MCKYNNRRCKNIKSEIIDGKEYRLVTLRGRSKLIAKDGSAINPYRRKQKCTTFLNEDGYPCFGGSVPVHLYVAHAWVDGYFDGAEVNHKDFDRENYDADNLEWVTHEENIQKSVEGNYDVICKSKQGVRNGRATFTEEQIKEIRYMYDNLNMTVADIVHKLYPNLETKSKYKTKHSLISKICKRETWITLN